MQIADAHNDVLMSFVTQKQIDEYTKFCKNNKVVKLFTAYYVSQKQEQEGSDRIFSDIEGKFAMLNHCDFAVKTFENIGYVRTHDDLIRFIRLQPFCATLTWNYANCLAGGALSREGLTDWGRIVITELCRNNIVIDTAHLNEKSFLQYADNFDLPIFCSHTGSKNVYSIERNLTNDQLKCISKSHGFVGLCLYNTLLCEGKADFETIRRHLDIFLEYAGIDSVGFGTDFNGTGEQNPTGFTLDYCGMTELYDYLLRFFSQEIVEKIFYQNLVDFISRKGKSANLVL